jgi:hypothetical protein
MENQKHRIEFYRQRTFSEKLNVTFDFIRENWKPLLKYAFYLIMPICLIQAFVMNAFINGYFNVLLNGNNSHYAGKYLYDFVTNYGIILLCTLTGSALLAGLVYALMQTYATRAERLQNLTFNDIRERVTGNTWKCLRIFVFLIFSYLALIALAALLTVLASAYSLILTIPVLILFMIGMIILMMLVPAYIFEQELSFVGAIKKAWKLGTATLGGMIGLMIVISVIASVIQMVTTLPWYITLLVGNIMSIATESRPEPSVVYKFILYLFGIIQSFGAYVSFIIGLTGLAFHYFHAREKVEGVSIESNISNFNKL